ncbi:MAG: PAS domain S-box protein [Cyanomargarita calcarea GSE-NOS-MK-12-04C]|jgi:PAS domain S-box-containing protein|uniref:histidine kinase n=1 Tax=Cyanomargarita calcarea GSE-NOS-MK-12-04C TaxID=2839659 RepID=A0A951UUW9_9CYAN|nr:PAS domain S-box protein [Cyanomargarita calcarea GSE-NOS-MK-12-04C]
MRNFGTRSAINRHPLTITQDALVKEALALMSQTDSRGIVVLAEANSNSRPIGLFTEQDVVRLAAERVDLGSVSVASVMNKQFVSITETEAEDIFAVVNQIKQHQIRHLTVVGETGDFVGIITPQTIEDMIHPVDLLTKKQVTEVMSSGVISAKSSDSILYVAQLMSLKQVSCVVIVDSQLNPVGIITEHDIVQLSHIELDLAHTAAAIVMSTPLLPIRGSDSLWAADQMMQKHRVRRLVVSNNGGELLGIITQAKMLETINPLEMYESLKILQDLVADKTSELKLLNQQVKKEISTRKLVEDKLRYSEMKMRATLEAMSDIILVVNTQNSQLGSLEILPTNSIYLNERSTDLLSQTVEAFFKEKTAKIWLTKVRQALEKKQTLNFDYSLCWMREEVWFTASISPTSDTSAVWVARDITKRKRAEMLLWQSQERFRAIFEQAAVGINLVSLSGQFLQVNPRFCEILGYTESDLLQLSWPSITYPSDLGVYQEYVRRMFASESTDSIEQRLLCKDRQVRWGNISISLVRNRQEIPQYFITVVEDITQRKRAEIALCESEERFCGIFEQAAVGIKQIAISGEFLEVNQRLCEILGYTESELLAITVNDVIYQGDVESDLECKRQILASETATSSIEKRFVCKDGQLKWVKNSLSLVRNEEGIPQYFISVIEDISERKQLEEALKESQHWLQTIVSANPNVLYVYDLIEKRNVYCNREIYEILGYTQEEVFSMEMGFFPTVIHRDDLTAFAEHQLRLDTAKDGEIFELEYRMCHKNGEWRWRKSRYTLFSRYPNGNPKQILGTASDISDRKKAEAALQQSEARERNKAEQLEIALTQLQHTQTQLVLSEKMASLGSLVAGVAHEINNPTSFIYGNIEPAVDYAQQLLSLINLYQQHYPQPIGEISQELESIDLNFIAKDFPELLNSMKVGAQRITEIVLSLRNFSRLDESKCKLADIHEGIDNTLLLLQHRLKKHLNIPEIKIIKDYGQLPKVKCYPGQLNQVFMNIVCNAIDALEESFINQELSFAREFGEIHIRTQIVESKIIICIADNGLGVKTEIQPRIFDPFFTTKSPGKGTGLGLSISYQIVVDRHGGEIKCHSVFGQGTEFVIELPIV